MLKIVNPQIIIGQKYNNFLDIIEMKEHTHCYEFTLGNHTKYMNVETILLHRKQRNDGMYLMEYKGKFLPLNINKFDSIDKIIICMHTI